MAGVGSWQLAGPQPSAAGGRQITNCQLPTANPCHLPSANSSVSSDGGDQLAIGRSRVVGAEHKRARDQESRARVHTPGPGGRVDSAVDLDRYPVVEHL